MNDKEPDHGDRRPARSCLGSPLILVLGDDDGNDDVARGHYDSRSVSLSYVLSAWSGEDRLDDRWRLNLLPIAPTASTGLRPTRST